MSWLSNLISAPFRAVAVVVDVIDSEDILGIAESADNAAESVKEAVERITGEE